MKDIEILECLRNRHINDTYKKKSVSGALTRAIQALQEKQERENPQPLTFEKLLERNRKPVFVTTEEEKYWGICLVDKRKSGQYASMQGTGINHGVLQDEYGETWLAYDYEPKEATND